MKDLIVEVEKLVKEYGFVTINTSYKWYSPGKRNYEDGKIPNGVTRYNQGILHNNIVEILKQDGFEIEYLTNHNSFFYVTK